MIWFLRRERLLLIAFVMTSIMGAGAHSAEPDIAGEQKYVFSYFRNNGEDGLHFASSADGLSWTPLNADKPFTSPAVGGKLMRDPSIVRDARGVFHMVFTSGWWDLGFGYASSKDLINWTPHRFIPVNHAVAGAKNTWAPDLFYDEHAKNFVILFATTVPGRFPETDKDGDHNHRLYHVTTTDFQSFSPPQLAFDAGYNSIDGTLIAMNNGVTLFYKDERIGQKKLLAVTTPALGQPWSLPPKPVIDRDWVEGPTVLKVGTKWMMYFDCYRDGHYGAAVSNDGIEWKEITGELKMPKGVRHGTAFALPTEVMGPLMAIEVKAK